MKKNNKKPDFLDENKLSNKNTRKILKSQTGLLSSKTKKGEKPKKKHKVLKYVSGALAIAILGYIGFNTIRSSSCNKAPYKEPSSEDVINPNGNEFEFDDKDQIIMDKITENERKALLNNFSNLILQDANSRCDEKINKVENIVSFSLIPNNLYDTNNEYDKYCLSFLFKDDKDTLYALDYLVGKDFESSSEYSKNFFADFINYISFEGAINSCQKMSAEGEALRSVLDATYVGDAYLGYKESGDEYYFIPVYQNNGKGTVYCNLASVIDARRENPMEKLYNEQIKGGQDFSKISFVQSPTIQRAEQIFHEKLEEKAATKTNKYFEFTK